MKAVNMVATVLMYFNYYSNIWCFPEIEDYKHMFRTYINYIELSCFGTKTCSPKDPVPKMVLLVNVGQQMSVTPKKHSVSL